MLGAAAGMANGNTNAQPAYPPAALMTVPLFHETGTTLFFVIYAGILRDKSFANMPIEDFKLVVDVHLLGSANYAKAVWSIMKQQNYSRIVMTTSSSGIYGDFG